ncbi:HEAT repeat domain-containing protein [Nesterenkonia sp. CF4.4]|uniref:HEAT repeat domain-containing protein n=1 Tax=Nesterenkonia sp. CF4.4 TaxID=3373079 RepID=UPI003EE76305
MQVVVALLVLSILVMVMTTVSIKSIRSMIERWRGANQEKMEPLLEKTLHGGMGPATLRRVGLRRLDRDLTPMLVERIRYLHGSSRDQMLDLVRELGLVRRNQAALRSRRRWRRARAAERLGHLGGARQVEDLGLLVTDQDETVRAVAARALAQLGTPQAVEILVRTLDDPSELTRLRIAENLHRLGSQALPQLIAHVERRLVHDVGNGEKGLLAVLSVLGGTRSYQARPVLRETIEVAQSVAVRAGAVRALGRCGGPSDVRLLSACSKDGHWEVRQQAAHALRSIGDTSGIPALGKLMADEMWTVRTAAAEALAGMGLIGEDALVRFAGSRDAHVRDQAVTALEASGATARLVQELALQGPTGTRARTAISTLVNAGATRHLTDLATELSHTERETLGRMLQVPAPSEDERLEREVGVENDG